jgi:hypothetical protein
MLQNLENSNIFLIFAPENRIVIMEEKDMMIASEPVASHPLTSYADVMEYLHTIRISREDKQKVADRISVELKEPALSAAYDRLEHLGQLQNNWDGDGAKKVSYDALRNLRRVLLISDNDDWKFWMISPAPNGSLGLQSKLHTASISVGDSEFSFYSENSEGEDWDDNIKFTPSGFLEIMRRIV